MLRGTPQTKRPGATLAFVVPLLFVLLGLGALVVDLAAARLEQRRMQSAADAAALEGLSGRDDPTIPESDRDARRRQAAGDLVKRRYADTPDGFELTGGIPTGSGGFLAAQKILTGQP